MRLHILARLRGIGVIAFVLASSTLIPAFAQSVDLPFSHEAVTTSFADAQQKPTNINGLDLDPRIFQSLLSATRTKDGAFLLKPGAYAATVRSYCLHAGTHGPSSGDGYLYAPLKGPRSSSIQAVLRGSASHPEFSQQDVQLLIWIMETKTKLERYPVRQQEIARKLLSGKQLLQLQGGVLGLIPPSLSNKAISELGPEAQEAEKASERLESLLISGTATFAEIERAAVLPPMKSGTSVPRGQWSSHPGGFYIRYFPSSYSQTRIEIIVPDKNQKKSQVWTDGSLRLASFPVSVPAEGAPDSGPGSGAVEYDPTSNVAVPANTNSQRLGMSAMPPPGNIGDAEFDWKEITKEGDRGGHRCTETYAIFSNLSLGYTRKCTVEVCIPFSNYQGSISLDTANADTAVYGTAAAQETQQILNEDLESGDICRTWMEAFRDGLSQAIPGSTVSPVGTTKMK